MRKLVLLYQYYLLNTYLLADIKIMISSLELSFRAANRYRRRQEPESLPFQ